ncbi:MAG TPA: 1-deoxy-D-xylulose-5-phosphate synthase [Candidatus Polarisedimenticolia bacterium]|nr:1-deoxy-D-xylulose-5-phosphate synthase [Candidatus Polarisedimenticolia bacterium]
MSEAITGNLDHAFPEDHAGEPSSPARLLHRINSPADLKGMTIDQLRQLALELREELVAVVSRTGGHLAPSLGVVELSIALHYLFDSPKDKLVWDVGHQAYVHKMLTGRRSQLPTIRQHGGISGFLRIDESEHDCFGAGHASTSISAALGMATKRDLCGEKGYVVTVTGDGAMTGGLAYEALNNAGHAGRDMLVILNDNEMSISPNVGAISRYLTSLSTNPFLKKLREECYELLEKLPAGASAAEVINGLERNLKNVLVPGALFQALGFHYFGPIDGHDLQGLIEVIGRLRDEKGPILLHVLTKKGRGYAFAEEDPNTYHGLNPFDVASGKTLPSRKSPPAYTNVFAQAASELAERDRRVVAITAAMADGTGLVNFHRRFPDRFFDVGIAEAHGVTFAAGMALQGMRPIAAIYSTFLQRAYDQIIHDVGVQNIPVVFCLDRAGLCGPDGPTHHGVFDLTYLRAVPNFIVAAPKDGVELRNLLHTAVEQTAHPFAIRYPKEACPVDPSGTPFETIPIGSWEHLVEGGDVALLAVGTMVEHSRKVLERLAARGVKAGLVNCRFVKPMDNSLLLELASRYRLLITLEENTLRGGFGTGVYEELQALGRGPGRGPMLLHLGLPDQFILHGNREQLFDEAGLSPGRIEGSILDALDALGALQPAGSGARG